jgi:hypothetical protein
MSCLAGGELDDAAAETHRKGVARNFAAVHRAAKTLGGVPEMLSAGDCSEHGPDEKAVILYCAFLCSRLLECSREERSAHIIQRAWRQHKTNAVGGCWACQEAGHAQGKGERGGVAGCMAHALLPQPTTALPARAHADLQPCPRLCCAGQGRANLQRWQAAVAVIEPAVAAWLFRRAVGRMMEQHRRLRAAAVQLQAAWRGRQQRLVYQQQVAAAVTIQVGGSGWAGGWVVGQAGQATPSRWRWRQRP